MSKRTTRNNVMHKTNPMRFRGWWCGMPRGKCPVLLIIRFYEWLHKKFFCFVYPNNSGLTEEEKKRIAQLQEQARGLRQKIRESQHKEEQGQ